jgi:peptidoglycan hydrolase-like protein with peptidoglycan-binding domain
MASGALPAANIKVLIKDVTGDILYVLTTDMEGSTGQAALDVSDVAIGNRYHRMGFFDVEVPQSLSFGSVIIRGVEVYEGIGSELPILLSPANLSEGSVSNTKVVEVPREHGADWRQSIGKSAMPSASDYPPIPSSVRIPQMLTVHMGNCKDSSPNLRIPFLSYLKSATASEVYADWDNASLYANIYCLITFAVNRIFTEWYKNQGYSFDLTTDPSTDPICQEGRPIPENISWLVERSFNIYMRRKEDLSPIFPAYGSGLTPGNGLSQWGTQQMSLKGYSPLDIVRHYYGKSVRLEESDNFFDNEADNPSRVLSEGAKGEDVKHMQEYLNEIRENYPNIPAMENPNGNFDEDTKTSVASFQQIFGQTPNGSITKATWSKICLVHSACARLKELVLKGKELGMSPIPPDSTLYYAIEPSGGNALDIARLQHILNYIALFVPTMQSVAEDGQFGYETEEAVAAFQKLVNLPDAGIVTPLTWQKLYEEYYSIKALIERDPYESSDVHPGESILLEEPPLLFSANFSDAKRVLRTRTAFAKPTGDSTRFASEAGIESGKKLIESDAQNESEQPEPVQNSQDFQGAFASAPQLPLDPDLPELVASEISDSELSASEVYETMFSESKQPAPKVFAPEINSPMASPQRPSAHEPSVEVFSRDALRKNFKQEAIDVKNPLPQPISEPIKLYSSSVTDVPHKSEGKAEPKQIAQEEARLSENATMEDAKISQTQKLAFTPKSGAITLLVLFLLMNINERSQKGAETT